VVVAQSSSGEILTIKILLSGTLDALARTCECTRLLREKRAWRIEKKKRKIEREQLPVRTSFYFVAAACCMLTRYVRDTIYNMIELSSFSVSFFHSLCLFPACAALGGGLSDSFGDFVAQGGGEA